MFSPLPWKISWDWWPLSSLFLNLFHQEKVLTDWPFIFSHLRIQMVRPSFPDIFTCTAICSVWKDKKSKRNILPVNSRLLSSSLSHYLSQKFIFFCNPTRFLRQMMEKEAMSLKLKLKRMLPNKDGSEEFKVFLCLNKEKSTSCLTSRSCVKL